MGPAFYVVLAIAVILLAALIAVIGNLNKLKEQQQKSVEDNRKLISKVTRLETDTREATLSKDNLLIQYEELKGLYEDVNRIAFTDKLTELPNNTQFNDLFEGVIMTLREGEMAAVCVIRLSNYDRITNSAGHMAGDELMLDFTTRLKANITDDDFIARIAPDELAMISQNFDNITEYEDRMAKLYNVLCMPFENSARNIAPEVYMATAIIPRDGKNVQLLSLNVRLALSHAINEGEPKVYNYDASMAKQAMKRMELNALLNQTVSDNAFTYLCSAQMDLRTARPAALEIIPALDSPSQGRLLPKDYIDPSTDNLIAKRIFALTIKEACHKQKVFDNAGFTDINFIVGCLSGQFIDDDFVKIVYNALEESDATPSRILISVPEQVLQKKPAETIGLMRKLEKLGIRFILDEFGAGDSSLTALLNAPVALVRLSGALFDGETRISPDKFLSSFTELVHNWRLKLIATDVEFSEQETLLKKCHADYAQGKLYSGNMEEELALQFVRMSLK